MNYLLTRMSLQLKTTYRGTSRRFCIQQPGWALLLWLFYRCWCMCFCIKEKIRRDKPQSCSICLLVKGGPIFTHATSLTLWICPSKSLWPSPIHPPHFGGSYVHDSMHIAQWLCSVKACLCVYSCISYIYEQNISSLHVTSEETRSIDVH